MKTKKHYKIGILIDQLIIGGVQKIAIEDARALKKLGHHAEILVLMRKGYKPRYRSFAEGVKIRFLSDSYPLIFRHSFKFPIFSFFSTLHILSPLLAPFVIKEKEFDIVIGHGTTTCFTAKSLAKRRGIPYLAAIHDPMAYILKKAYSQSLLRNFFPFLTPILKKLEKGLIENSQKVLLLSTLHEKFITKTYGIRPIILPAATRIPSHLSKKQREYILAATRWEKKKNPNIFLEIAKTTGANIKIAGSWTNKDDYLSFRKEVEDQNLTSQIKLYPFVSEERLQGLYQGARLFVHPIIEAFSMGGLEAAANGCPVIIPQGSGITHYLSGGQDGIFIQKATTANFLQAVSKLWLNPKLAEKMGKSARIKVLEFSWENHAKNLIKIIEESLNQITIAALETGHSSESYLSGGDKLLEKMTYYFSSSIKVKIIIPEIGIKHWQEAKLKNVELITLPKTIFDNNPEPFFVFIAYLFRIVNSYFALRKLKRIDVVYSSTNVLPDVAPAFLFKLTKNTLWVSRVHHLIPPPGKRPGLLIINIVSYLMQSLSSFMMKTKSDKTIALNEKLKNLLIKKKFDQKTLAVLGAGIDFEKINREAIFSTKKSYDAIFVGRIHPSKGVYDLVEIWKEVTKKIPSAKALIVGGGSKEHESKLKQQIQNNYLSNNLIYTGYLSDSELLRNLKRSRIFLFTDYEAGWGIAIAEAMAAGLPVIGYGLEIFGDVFKKGFLTVPIGNKELFAQKVIYLLNDKGKYTKLSQEAVVQAQKMSWRETSAKFQKIIENLNN